jgi:glycosyltransferase involved in cell wall biosynthesis
MYSPQFHPLEGGYERAARRVSAELAARGHAVEVVAERRSRALPARDRVDGVPVRRLRVAYRRGMHTATASAALFAWLAANLRRFDVLHAHMYGPVTAAALAAARLARKPAVLKLASTGPDGIASLLAGRSPAMGAARALHRGVDACLAPSAAARDEAVAFGIPAERVHVLPNGVDTAALVPADDAARSAARQGLGIDPRAVLALCVARMRPEKGIRTLLSAWEQAAPAFPDARLVYVGDGPERPGLEAALSGSPVRATVVLAGQADPAPWYAAADLVVIPSDYEGLSNVLLEAMSAGLPVVSTRVSGAEDAFAAAGIGELAEPRDPASLAAALRRLLGDAERRRACGRAARGLAVERFSLSSVVDGLERIYAGVLHRPGA